MPPTRFVCLSFYKNSPKGCLVISWTNLLTWAQHRDYQQRSSWAKSLNPLEDVMSMLCPCHFHEFPKSTTWTCENTAHPQKLNLFSASQGIGISGIWVKYHNSLTWVDAIWGWFPLWMTCSPWFHHSESHIRKPPESNLTIGIFHA